MMVLKEGEERVGRPHRSWHLQGWQLRIARKNKSLRTAYLFSRCNLWQSLSFYDYKRAPSGKIKMTVRVSGHSAFLHIQDGTHHLVAGAGVACQPIYPRGDLFVSNVGHHARGRSSSEGKQGTVLRKSRIRACRCFRIATKEEVCISTLAPFAHKFNRSS